MLEAKKQVGGRTWEIGALSNVVGFHSGESLATAIQDDLEANPRITLLTNAPVVQVERKPGSWILPHPRGDLLARQLIVATGTRARAASECSWLRSPGPVPILSPDNAVDGMVVLGNDRVIDASLRQRALSHVRVLWPGSTSRLSAFRRQYPTVDVRCIESVRLSPSGQQIELEIDQESGPTEAFLTSEVRLAAGQIRSLPTFTGVHSPRSNADDIEFCGDCEPNAVMRLAVAMGSGAAAASRAAKRLTC